MTDDDLYEVRKTCLYTEAVCTIWLHLCACPLIEFDVFVALIRGYRGEKSMSQCFAQWSSHKPSRWSMICC